MVVALSTAQVSADAPNPAVSTPSLASWRSTPWKASVAISSETVKPMPAIVPPPRTEAQPTGGLIRPRVMRVTTNVTPATPIGLPSM